MAVHPCHDSAGKTSSMQSALIEWLKNNDLERFGPIFEENEVELETLRLLTDDDLKEIGLAFGPRKRILNLLREEKALDKSGPSALFVGAPVGERRQLTVLFCDLVGFTALSQTLDPEALQVVIRAYEETCASCIVRYEGYVFTCLGDGVVAFFGFPLAHEGEAGRAIRAGLDIIEAMASLQLPISGRLQVRIGVATGIVVVSTGERNAVGDTMNLASRLQTIAEPGSLIVSERSRRLAGGEFFFEDLGFKELKGVSGPTRVFRVVGVSEAESRFEAASQRGLTMMVGRNEEIGNYDYAITRLRIMGRGRDGDYSPPPAQIPACGFPAPGSCRRSNVTGVRGLAARAVPVRRQATPVTCLVQHRVRGMLCHLPSLQPGPFPPPPPPPFITGLFGRFIGTTSPSDSSPVPRQLRLLDFLSRPGIAVATAGQARSPRFRRDPFMRDGVFDQAERRHLAISC